MIKYVSIIITIWFIQSQNKYDTFMKTYVEQHQFNGVVLVAHQGKIIFQHAYGYANVEKQIPLKPSHQFLIGSLTKSFTAMLAIKLSETDKINLDVPLQENITELKSPIAMLSLRNLIQMNTGLPSRIEHVVSVNDSPINESTLLNLLDHQLMSIQPTNEFNYSNLSYNLAALVMAHQTNYSYKVLMDSIILNPLEMKNSLVLRNDDMSNIAIGYNINERSPTGKREKGRKYNMSYAIGSGDMVSTAIDLLKLDQALYGIRFISDQNKHLLFTSRGEKNGDYGFGFKIKSYIRTSQNEIGQLVRHGGSMDGYLSNFHRYLDDQLTVIVLSNIRPVPIMDITVGLKEVFFGREMKERNGIY